MDTTSLQNMLTRCAASAIDAQRAWDDRYVAQLRRLADHPAAPALARSPIADAINPRRTVASSFELTASIAVSTTHEHSIEVGIVGVSFELRNRLTEAHRSTLTIHVQATPAPGVGLRRASTLPNDSTPP